MVTERMRMFGEEKMSGKGREPAHAMRIMMTGEADERRQETKMK